MSGEDIVKTANSLLGTKYKYGGSTVDGFDCSGFVYYCHQQNGYTTPRTSSSLYTGGSGGDGSAGDVVCWDGHVGICDGSGNVIHAYGTTNGKVRTDSITNVSKWDNRTVKGYRRYWQPKPKK